MTIGIQNLKVNNSVAENASVLVPLDAVTINWDFISDSKTVTQNGYEIKLASNSVAWGTSAFNADILNQPFVRDSAQYWRIKPKFIQRGLTYYGQIRVKDNLGNESEYYKFRFVVNRVPFVTNASISPSDPSTSDDLNLMVDKSQSTVSFKVKWFRNGKYYNQFDDFTKISKEYLRFGDSWSCEITPTDTVESGVVFNVKSVKIVSLPPVSKNLKILPYNPNVQDIIEASFSTIDGTTNKLAINDKSIIKWYVNDQLIENATNYRFLRYAFKPNDEVFFTVVPFDGITYGQELLSNKVIILDSDFRVQNIFVDGKSNNLQINSVNPTITWNVFSPYNRMQKFVHVKIGTAPGSDNILSQKIATTINSFNVPNNLVRRGIDYYVSIAVSDDINNFSNFETTRFRVLGNLWNTEVDNSVGYTLEFSAASNYTEEPTANPVKFFYVNIADGTRSARLQFYVNAIKLILGNNNVLTYNIDTTVHRNYTVVGKNNSIKIYCENILILDGTDKLEQYSTDKYLEIGNDVKFDITTTVKRFVYTVQGDYEPGDEIYSRIQFEKYVDFSDASVSTMSQNDGLVYVGVNSVNIDESGKMYVVDEGQSPIQVSLENIDRFDLNINSISISPNDTVVNVNHNLGVSSFTSFFIPKFDNEAYFTLGVNPLDATYELVKTTSFDATSYINEGLVIDTTIGYRQSILTTTSDEVYIKQETDAITFASIYESIFNYDFDLQIANNTLIIYLKNTSTVVFETTLENKTVDSLINDLNNLVTSENYFFGLYYEVYINNSAIGSQSAANIDSLIRTNLFPSKTLQGNFEILDVYQSNPYGTLSTGKWYYTQRKKGTAWFDKVNNEKGWTVDIDLRIDAVEDSDTPANTDTPKGVGLYLNDGKYAENIWFLPQELIIQSSNKSITHDVTTFTNYRICGKQNKMKIFAKKNAEIEYSLLSESSLKTAATNQGNAARPHVCIDPNGDLHAVWHDDGLGVSTRQIYYSKYTEADKTWSEPIAIVSDVFSSSNPKIAVDSKNNLYVVFETTKADYTDISVIINNGVDWSDPYILSSGLYDSVNPEIIIDAKDNVHVVWEDYRFLKSQIFYVKRNSNDGLWSSTVARGNELQITKDVMGAKRPSITSYDSNIYVTWTSFNEDGTSVIKLNVLNGYTNTWSSTVDNSYDYVVSGLNANRCDNSSICIDLKGQILVVWQDLVDNNLQLFCRFINNKLAFAKEVIQLTIGDFDASHAECGLDINSGDIYVVFEKQQEIISTPSVDPYDPYGSQNASSSIKNPSIYLLKYDVSDQKWYSSNQSIYKGYSYAFDEEFVFDTARITHRPVIVDRFRSSLHILFESTETSVAGEVISNKNKFTQIRDINYDFTFEPSYVVSAHDLYGDGELRLDGNRNRKEIRFGDFSDSVSSRMVVGSIRYYCGNAVDPFSIRLINKTTTNMADVEVLCSVPNNRGDMWLGTNLGLIFYDKKLNQAFHIKDKSDGFGISSDYAIHDMCFDSDGNMFVLTHYKLDEANLRRIFISVDHSYFYEIPIETNHFTALATDSNGNLFVVADNRIAKGGLYIVPIAEIVQQIINPTETPIVLELSTEKPVKYIRIPINPQAALDDQIYIDNLYVIKIDEANVAWIGSDNGFIRYASGDSIVFQMQQGLSSNRVNDIAIRNTAIRYIATSAGVNKMVGLSISPIDYDNTNLPPASLDQIPSGDFRKPVNVDARKIMWKEPNSLFVASHFNIYQITFLDESFSTERVEVTKYNTKDFTLTDISPTRNDDLQNFAVIVPKEYESILDSLGSKIFCEVALNGNKITRGFVYSHKYKLLKFEYPLLESDVVKLTFRSDINEYADFKQNLAEKYAVGNKATRINKIVATDDDVHVTTHGDVNALFINKPISQKPTDSIILDRTPPTGKLILGQQKSSTVFEVNIDPIEADVNAVFDNLSGIDKMIISNYQNFTSDGENLIIPTSFSRTALHDVGNLFNRNEKYYTFTSGVGSRICIFNNMLWAATSSPANIYRMNDVNNVWTLVDTLDVVDGIPNPNATVEFMINYGGTLYVGTGSETGIAKVYAYNTNTNKFDLFRVFGGSTHAYCSLIHDNKLFIGVGGTSGAIYSWDKTKTETIVTNIDVAVYAMTSYENYIFAATGNNGRIYEIDPKNKNAIIVDVNSDPIATSIASININDVAYAFAGYSSNAQIKRVKLPDGRFIHSFKTISAKVNAIKSLSSANSEILYASIGNTLYYLDYVWTAKHTHTEGINDFIMDGNGNIWYISDTYVYRIARNTNLKNVYLKLIDKAGNETSLRDSDGELDPNYFTSIDITTLSTFFNKNRILQVDEFGNTVELLRGSTQYFSADKIDEEKAEYFSEIFNGSNNFVAWDRITWDATIPNGTSIVVEIRTATTKDLLLNSEFAYKVDGNDLSANISFLSGQFLQFKITLLSKIRDLSPNIRNVVVKSIATDSTHFFTTNFILPSKMKKGILTATKMLPISADIVFGVNTNNSTDFSEYQIIDENRIFSIDESQYGKNMRVGIKFITPAKATASEFTPEYTPYDENPMLNSVSWSYISTNAVETTYNFKVYFYSDYTMQNLIYTANSQASSVGFSVNDEIFPTGGKTFAFNDEASFSYVPVNESNLKCNTIYYVKVEAYVEEFEETILHGSPFYQSCATTYVDTIGFDYTNISMNTESYHFRIRFYNDAERTDLKYTAFSGNDISGWFIDANNINVYGVSVEPAQSVSVTYTPSLSNIDPSKTYYLTIDAFDGSVFESTSDAYTFRANDLSNLIYCGDYANVPVLKNFAIMFELENNQFITLKVNT